MKSGKIRFFNKQRGFGFIKTDENIDYFFVYGSVAKEYRDSIKDGDEVTFELVQVLDRGQMATLIKLKDAK